MINDDDEKSDDDEKRSLEALAKKLLWSSNSPEDDDEFINLIEETLEQPKKRPRTRRSLQILEPVLAPVPVAPVPVAPVPVAPVPVAPLPVPPITTSSASDFEMALQIQLESTEKENAKLQKENEKLKLQLKEAQDELAHHKSLAEKKEVGQMLPH